MPENGSQRHLEHNATSKKEISSSFDTIRETNPIAFVNNEKSLIARVTEVLLKDKRDTSQSTGSLKCTAFGNL